MSDLDRRQFFKGILDSLVQVAGTVVLASATASIAKAQAGQSAGAELPEDLQGRADRLAAAANVPAEETSATNCEFLNGAFLNTPLGSFANGSRPAVQPVPPIGVFRNLPQGGVFRNAPLGSFRNTALGPFANGGWRNDPWGGFRNGGWSNSPWRNW
jgi:hypothetical protein